MKTPSPDAITEWKKMMEGQPLLYKRGIRRLFNQTANIETAFNKSPRVRSVTCVDEGVREGIHLAGSGVLLTPNQRSTELAAAGVTEFTTHDNCGAFTVAFPHETNANRACREWGAAEARRLGLPHRHIGAIEMDRHPHLHTASVIYYDATGAFNRIPGLPKGFVVSRKSFGSGPSDLTLCLGITFGSYGFGTLFTKTTPLTVVLLPHPTDRNFSLDLLKGEAEIATAPYGRRVRIDGFKTAWVARL